MQGAHRAHNRHAAHAKRTLSTYKEVMAIRYQEITVIYANDSAYFSTQQGLPQGIPSPNNVISAMWLCLHSLIPISQ